MFKHIITVLVISGMLFAFGCSSPATPDTNSDLESFSAGVSPTLTGVIGDYTFTANDGSIETGTLVADEDGKITLVSERGASVYSNWWFIIDVEYHDERGFTGMGLPYYYINDTMPYTVKVDYKRGLPLDAWPIIYGKLTAEQRYFPGMGLLPGASTEVWDPFLIPANGYVEVNDDYYIPSGTIPGNDCTVVQVDMQLICGLFQFTMIRGICAYWDP